MVFVANPQAKVYELPLLTTSERNQLLVEWNNNQTNWQETRTIDQLFVEQAANKPNATAVVFNQEKLTYQQLNQRVDKLAQKLVAMKVKPGVRVGICLERCFDMAIAPLAVSQSWWCLCTFRSSLSC